MASRSPSSITWATGHRSFTATPLATLPHVTFPTQSPLRFAGSRTRLIQVPPAGPIRVIHPIHLSPPIHRIPGADPGHIISPRPLTRMAVDLPRTASRLQEAGIRKSSHSRNGFHSSFLHFGTFFTRASSRGALLPGRSPGPKVFSLHFNALIFQFVADNCILFAFFTSIIVKSLLCSFRNPDHYTIMLFCIQHPPISKTGLLMYNPLSCVISLFRSLRTKFKNRKDAFL